MRSNRKRVSKKGVGQGPKGKNSKILSDAFQALMRKFWRTSFPQERSFARVTEIVTALLAGTGRKTLAASILFRGKDQDDWSADYRAFSKSPWDPNDLFRGVLKAALPLLPTDAPVVLALDDTAIDRTSHRIYASRWCHDPLAPVFVNPPIKWGIPLLHAALLLPPGDSKRPTALTVALEPILGKASKKRRGKPGRPQSPLADPDPQEAPSPLKTPPMATELAVQVIRRIRQWLDEAGVTRKLLVVVDASYCNRTVIEGLPDRTELVGRTRTDARLFRPLPKKQGKAVYGTPLPTPKEIGESTAHPELRGSFIYGCDTYPLRWKEVAPVLWKNGTKTRRMRLVVLQPTRHGTVGNRGYRRIGYLMATDLKEKAEVLIQAYLSRWEIEVLHRILKTDFGIGDHQCNESSARIYAALAAGYALLALASRQATGEVRSALHHQLPKWQQNYQAWREARRRLAGRPLPVYRATSRDTVALLRKGLAMKWKDGINRCA